MKKLVLVLLVGIALGFVFWAATTPVVKAASSKCIVCHHDKNQKGPQSGPHEVAIPCDQVDKYLQDHPEDSAGPCHATEVQNP